MIPGLIGWALYQKGLLALPLKGDGSLDGDAVFATMVRELLPTGLRGLIVACLLAALMSSLASLFNSTASLFTIDIYEKLRPGKSGEHLVFVGRVATASVVALGVVWIPVMAHVSQGGLYRYLQSVQGYLAPSIFAVFFLGVFWARLNATGAVWGLATGFVCGMIKLFLQIFFGKGEGKLHEPAILAAIGDFNFLFATGILFLLSALAMIVASYLTAPPPPEKVKGLTYGSIHEEAKEEIKKSWDIWNKLMALLILAGVLAMYLYFSFWLK
jgi:SSS family solute:Na+ symporter